MVSGFVTRIMRAFGDWLSESGTEHDVSEAFAAGYVAATKNRQGDDETVELCDPNEPYPNGELRTPAVDVLAQETNALIRTLKERVDRAKAREESLNAGTAAQQYWRGVRETQTETVEMLEDMMRKYNRNGVRDWHEGVHNGPQ